MSSDSPQHPLRVVDARELDPEYRSLLRPGELMPDAEGQMRRLPRFFYEVPSWEMANEVQLTPHFTLAEFLRVDVREARLMRVFPRYVPCAVGTMAAHLELFREAVEDYVYIAANGGYRSPGHRLTTHASPHLWGTAANIYRIGDRYLDDQESIERYAELASDLLPGFWVRPYGHGRGYADDHLHLDIGFLTAVPRGAAGEEESGSAEAENAREESEAA